MLKVLTAILFLGWCSTAYAFDYPPDGSHVVVTRSQISQYTKLQILKAIAYAKTHRISWNIIEDAVAAEPHQK